MTVSSRPLPVWRFLRPVLANSGIPLVILTAFSWILSMYTILSPSHLQSSSIPGHAGLTIDGAYKLAFWSLFAFRYWRLFVHCVANFYYEPSEPARIPRFRPQDVTVIIPTVDPGSADMRECVETISRNGPRHIIVVTAGVGFEGARREKEANELVSSLPLDPQVLITAYRLPETPNKRRQVASAIDRIPKRDGVTVLADDHVFWPDTFLEYALAPFEDENVHLVGTKKLVRFAPGESWWDTYWNFLGCVYLERHNFELTATNAIDDSVFVISGRTCLIRNKVLKDPSFRHRFVNETYMGKTLMPDDDNFITRWCLRKGWGIKFQAHDKACVETTLGTYPKFLQQCTRWAQTTFRSNPQSLLLKNAWENHPWSIYAIYLNGFVNFALLIDGLLIFLLLRTTYFRDHGYWTPLALVACILCAKGIKLVPFFARLGDRRAHAWLFPAYVLFAYYHGLIKAWALLTTWDTTWKGRKADDGGSQRLDDDDDDGAAVQGQGDETEASGPEGGVLLH